MLFKALQYLIAGVVDEPGKIAIDRIETSKLNLYYLSAPRGEMGRLLGRQGRTVEAMRDVLTAIARKVEKEAIIDVIEQRLEITKPATPDRRRDHPSGRQHQRGNQLQRGSQRPGQPQRRPSSQQDRRRRGESGSPPRRGPR